MRPTLATITCLCLLAVKEAAAGKAYYYDTPNATLEWWPPVDDVVAVNSVDEAGTGPYYFEYYDSKGIGYSAAVGKGGLADERSISTEPVTTGIITGLTAFVTPQRAQAFLANRVFGFVSVQLLWLWAHFLFWDYSTTQPAEEFSTTALVRFLGNKDVAVFNQFAVWGTAIVTSIMMLLPAVFLNTFGLVPAAATTAAAGKKKRSVEEDFVEAAAEESDPEADPRNFATLTEPDFNLTLRQIFCPICVARIITYNVITFLSAFILWNVTPLLRNSATSTPLAAGKRKKREAEDEDEDEDVAEAGPHQEAKQTWLEDIEDTLARAVDKFASYEEDQEDGLTE